MCLVAQIVNILELLDFYLLKVRQVLVIEMILDDRLGAIIDIHRTQFLLNKPKDQPV